MSNKSSQGAPRPQWQWTPDKIVDAVLGMRAQNIITREEARGLLRPFFGLAEAEATEPTVAPVPDPVDDATGQGRC